MTTQRLKVGDIAPDFWTRDIHGAHIDLNKLSGHTLLAFLRYAGCPFCNLAIYRLSHEYKKLREHECEVVAFIQSTEGNIEKNITLRHEMTPPFSIISDQDQDFYRLFGVSPNVLAVLSHTFRHAPKWMDATFKKGFKQANVDGSGAIVPALFLLDKDKIIQMVDYSANFYKNSTFDDIYKMLGTIQR